MQDKVDPSQNANKILDLQARGKHNDSQFMVKVYVQNMIELNHRGMPLPNGVTQDDLIEIKDYFWNINVYAEGKNE